MSSSIPNTPQDLLKRLDKELEKLWEDLTIAQGDFEYHTKEVKYYKGIMDSARKQIEEKEQYINNVKAWRKG